MILIAMLLVVLIAVVLFREEIRFIIGTAITLSFLYWLWQQGSWMRGLVFYGGVVFVAIVIYTLMEKRPAAGQAPPTPQPQSPAGDYNSWYYADNGKQYGPVTEEQLLAALAARQLPPDTLIRCGINPAWNPAKQLWAGRF